MKHLTAESYVNGGLSTKESILFVSRFMLVDTIIGIQRICQQRIKIALLMSWATIFCAPLQLLGNDLCELGNVFLCVPLLQEKQNKGKRIENTGALKRNLGQLKDHC